MQRIAKWFDDQKGLGLLSRQDGVDVVVHGVAITTNGVRNLQESHAGQWNGVQGKQDWQAEYVDA